MEAIQKNIKKVDDALQRCLDIGQVQTKLLDHPDEGQQVLVMPANYIHFVLKRELDHPKQKVITLHMNDYDSFIRYVNEHKGPDSRIFAPCDGENMYFIRAYIDYHETGYAGAANYLRHIVNVQCAFSDDFTALYNHHKQEFTQEEWATFIQEYSHIFVSPDSGTMMDLALSITGNRDVTYKSHIRQQNGNVQFTYEENDNVQAGQGLLDVPENYLVFLPIFEGDAPSDIKPLLRWRLSRGGIVFHYVIPGLRKMLNDRFRRITDEIFDKTELPVFFGSVVTSK